MKTTVRALATVLLASIPAWLGCGGERTVDERTCTHKDKVYQDQEVWTDDCNTCKCNPEGSIGAGCSTMKCLPGDPPDKLDSGISAAPSPDELDSGISAAHTLDECAQVKEGDMVIYCCNFCAPTLDILWSAGASGMGPDGKCIPFCHACMPAGFSPCRR